jgi:RHS repeat-associated protein
MQLGSDAQIPDGLLAAMTLLNEKPHQGVPSWKSALHQGISEANCTAAIGIRASEQLNRVWPRYTGKERDTESGLDYFGARYYGSNMGRFMSPDFNSDSDEIEPVPYANLSNPQTLNLYSYARNNPLSLRDESGHVPCGGSASVTINVNANGTSSMSQSADDCPTLGFIDTMMFYRQRFINNVNANAAAHQPPPQPNNKGQALQDLNNIMMGAVLIGGPIAPKIKNTLDSIDKTGEAPPGQQGGRNFENDGRGGGQKLPSSDPNGNPINYKEWDVNAKQPGVNRGGERLVTGSDGSAYSTTDHYQTFTRVR